MQKKFEVVIKQKVFRAKNGTYEKCHLWDAIASSMHSLRDYCPHCMELKEKNPNTTVTIEVEPPEDPDSEERKFKRIYICLGPLKDGFKAGGRDFLVESEKQRDSWKWQKGVIPAIAENFPNAEHRFCLKHIYDNMKLSWRGRAKSNILLNNLCEVLNRQLLDGRDKPIITCLEYIREYLMKRIVNVQKVQDKCDGPLTPSTAKIFKLIVRAAAKLKVEWNGSDLYQVGHNSRGCKSKKGGGSQQAGVAGHGDAAHGSQQAGVHGSQTTQSTPQAS
ncbi:hypothetical protein Tco_0072243 [Tanacetum coccineum]